MKLTLSWLKDHLDTTASLQEICDKLITLGLEVEKIEDPAEKLKGFVVGHVIEHGKHPNADRLSLCKVDDGSGTLWQVVCGAHNVRQGLKIAFAREGIIIPETGQPLKKGVIREIESNGMICSARELMLGDDHDGIMELDSDLAPGTDLAEALGINDPVIELSITPNRPDCFGVRGIARDLAASGLGTLKPLTYKPVSGTFDSPLKVIIENSQLCPEFCGVFIRNVQNRAAPDIIRRRLELAGQKSINALVDVTNYITIDLGRPLHIFDARKLEGDLQVTSATGGEKFEALNNKDYILPQGATIIKSGDKIVSLGAIMGGRESGASEDTTDIFLECALWDPIQVAATGRELQILSDARTRFERGVDPESIELGINAGAQLVLDWCGGEASHVTVASHTHGKPVQTSGKTITLTQHKLWSLSGFEVSLTQASEILSRLGFKVTQNKTELKVTVPTFRPDIEGAADLVEEVLRLIGYDNIPAIPLPQIAIEPKAPRKSEVIRRVLASRGLNECQTWAFIPEDKASYFGGQDHQLKLENPISIEMSVMRPSILPNLLDAALRNHNRDVHNSRLFEVATQFSTKGQHLMASGIRSHNTHDRHWQTAIRSVDVFDAKSDALAILSATGLSNLSYQVEQGACNHYHPGRSGTLRQGNRILGYFGEIHPRILKHLDIDFPVVGFEAYLDLLPEPKLKKSIGIFSNFQPVTRDFAFVVDKDLPAEKIISTIQKLDKQLITAVSLFDVYAGDKMESGKKSIAVEVRLEPSKATLTDAELQDISNRIISQVEKTTGGKIRE